MNNIKKIFETKKAECLCYFGDTPAGRERSELAALRAVARKIKKDNNNSTAKSVFFRILPELSAYNRGEVEREVWTKI